MSEPQRVPVRVWMQQLRSDGEIVKLRLATLLLIGTYMDSDGSNGHVRESTLAEALGVTGRAVRDHLAYACERGYLRRVSRGHRLGDGTTTASTYEATAPSTSTGTAVPVETASTGSPVPVDTGSQPEDPATSTGRSEGLNRKLDESQPEDPGFPNKEDQVPDQEQTKISPVRGSAESGRRPDDQSRERCREDPVDAAIDEMYQQTGKEITPDHAQKIVTEMLRGRPVGDPAAYIRKGIANDPVRWLRFGETGHETIARLMGTGSITRDPGRNPEPGGCGDPRTYDVQPPPATPNPPEPAEHAVPAGQVHARAGEIKRRLGQFADTKKVPPVGRAVRTPNDQPELTPDPDVQRLVDHRKREALAALEKMMAEQGQEGSRSR